MYVAHFKQKFTASFHLILVLNDSASCYLEVLQGRGPVYNFYFACTWIESFCNGETTWFPSRKKFQVCTTACNQISPTHLILLHLSTLEFWRICNFYLTILEWNQTTLIKSHAETFQCSIYHLPTCPVKFVLFWFSVNKSRNSFSIMAQQLRSSTRCFFGSKLGGNL